VIVPLTGVQLAAAGITVPRLRARKPSLVAEGPRAFAEQRTPKWEAR
jgi:hypothetical protein